MSIINKLIEKKCQYCAFKGNKCTVDNCDNFAVIALREAHEEIIKMVETVPEIFCEQCDQRNQDCPWHKRGMDCMEKSAQYSVCDYIMDKV